MVCKAPRRIPAVVRGGARHRSDRGWRETRLCVPPPLTSKHYFATNLYIFSQLLVAAPTRTRTCKPQAGLAWSRGAFPGAVSPQLEPWQGCSRGAMVVSPRFTRACPLCVAEPLHLFWAEALDAARSALSAARRPLDGRHVVRGAAMCRARGRAAAVALCQLPQQPQCASGMPRVSASARHV